MFPFDPPENIRKPLVFWCFQGDQKETLERKGLIHSLCWIMSAHYVSSQTFTPNKFQTFHIVGSHASSKLFDQKKKKKLWLLFMDGVQPPLC